MNALVGAMRLIVVGIVGSGCAADTGRAQEPPAEVHAQAQRLMREAAGALADGDAERVLAKATEVARLLPDDGRVQQRAAELLYRAGHPRVSLAYFERAVELEPARTAHNWQRGIALATCGDFERAAEQFRVHHQVNPDDVENSAWYFLCVAKSTGLAAARAAIIPSRGDVRQPMMSVLRLLREELAPGQVIEAAEQNTRPGQERATALFYADLYLGLYHDALGQADQAVHYLERSLGYEVTGYMVDTARVYLDHRFKSSSHTARTAQP